MSSKDSISVTFLPSQTIAEASHGETILEVALRNKVELAHSCGGNGTCGTCRVIIETGISSLESRTEIEDEFACDRQFSNNERLACQAQITNQLTVRVPLLIKD